MNRHDAHLIAEELYKVMEENKPLGDEPLLTSAEAAEYLHMSLSHFSHISIRFSRVKSGKRWLYPKKQLQNNLIHGEL
jgi:hypothetical protein